MGNVCLDVLCQLTVKPYIDRVCIVERNMEDKLENHSHVCKNLVLCFNVKNSLLKFVEPFLIHPVCEVWIVF